MAKTFRYSVPSTKKDIRKSFKKTKLEKNSRREFKNLCSFYIGY